MNQQKRIITIGGGIAGIEVSSVLSSLGYEVIMMEKSSQTGGKLNNWHHLFPNSRPAIEVNNFLRQKIQMQSFPDLKQYFRQPGYQRQWYFRNRNHHRAAASGKCSSHQYRIRNIRCHAKGRIWLFDL